MTIMLREENRLIFAERLKRIREERSVDKDILQKDVADAIGLSPRAYAHYEEGRSHPDLFTLARICRYLDISADYLLGLTDVPRSYNNNKS